MNQRPVQHRFFKACGSAACLLALGAMLGGHWAALQSVAWARMLGQYARQESLGTALAKTFDGRHPCPLCVMIQHGRQQEQGQPKDLPGVKRGEAPDLVCEIRATPMLRPPISARKATPFVPGWNADFFESPPTPPPRAA